MLVTLLMLACSTTETGVPEGVMVDTPIAVDAKFAPDRIIVGHMGRVALPALETSNGNERFVMERLKGIHGMDASVYTVPEGVSVRAAVAQLRATGQHTWVEPDYIRQVRVNDPYRSYQWHFDEVNAEAAWAQSTGSGIVVAVIDTGVSSGPYDGIGSLGSGYDFVNNDSNPADDNGHGSHVAGTIGQASDNGVGVAGLAYGASIMPIKVLNAGGSGYTSDIVAGINYATSNGADVINMSIGGGSYSTSEATAVSNAYTSGVFVAAASGNSGTSTVEYPARYNGAVAVGATRYGTVRASYSNRGTDLDLSAPGGDTSRDDNGDGYSDGVLQETVQGGSWSYYFFDGTSMATPHVAAAAALLMSAGASNTEAETYLKDYATDLGSAGFDTSYGYGFIQPDAALAAYIADSGGGGIDTSPPVDTDTGTVDTDTGTVDTDTGTVDTDTGTVDTDTGTVDTSPPDCTINISKAQWNRKRGRLTLEVVSSDAATSDTMSVHLDSSYSHDMSYNAGKAKWTSKTTHSSKPSTVEVDSSCGGTDSISL